MFSRGRTRTMDFYPRPPRGGRLSPDGDMDAGWKFLSTPSARRATSAAETAYDAEDISIHALREEGDLVVPVDGIGQNDFYPRPPRGGRHKQGRTGTRFSLISIHALREEGDPPPRGPDCPFLTFLSTPSARRATDGRRLTSWGGVLFLSTPSARRATKRLFTTSPAPLHFYPRPPRGGRRW